MTDWAEIQLIKEWLRNYEFKDMPSLGSGWFVCRPVFPFYKWSLNFIASVKVEEQKPNKIAYGWVLVEDNEVGKKIYATKEVALHAVMQKKRDNGTRAELAIKPIYLFDQAEWRDYQISILVQNNFGDYNI